MIINSISTLSYYAVLYSPFFIVLNSILIALALIFLLTKESELPNLKVLWAIIIIFAPLGYLLFFFIGKNQLDESS